MAFEETKSRDGILLNKSPSILHAPTFCIHFNQAISHKRNWLTTTLNDLLVSTPAFFKCKDTSTCIQHPHKSDRVWLHTFLLPFSKIVPVPSSLAHISHVPIPWWSRWPHCVMASCWTLYPHHPCSHILYTCQPSYPHKRNWFATTLNDLFMNIPALFKFKYAGTCIQHPYNSNSLAAHLHVAFVKIILLPAVLAHILHVPISW
jgi:hypothetical protein